jgi:SAM-dependent methyltransferase
VLEIGSGPVGTISHLPWGERYAVEPLEAYFASQPELIRHRNPEVRYLEGSGERLPFEAGFFSLVICENVLDHTRSPAQVLAEARRVLAPRGFLFLSVNIHTGWGRLVRRAMEAFRIDKGHPHSYSRYTLRRLLEAGGYEVLHEEWEGPVAVWWRDLRSGGPKGLLKAGAGISEMAYRSVSSVSATG